MPDSKRDEFVAEQVKEVQQKTYHPFLGSKSFKKSSWKQGSYLIGSDTINGCFWFPFKRCDRWHSPSPNWQYIHIYIYHLYTTYILPSGGLYATYHLLREPETTIDSMVYLPAFLVDVYGKCILYRYMDPMGTRSRSRLFLLDF